MGLAPEKASTEIPVQSVGEKLILVAGLIHYLLDSISASMHAIDCVKRVLLIIVSVSTHQRPNLAYGISLYVSDYPRGSNVCVTSPRRVLWPRGADGNMKKASSVKRRASLE